MPENKSFNMPMLMEKAPPFHAITTNGEVKFPEDYHGKWVVFFSHPADFTPVCSTEFLMFAKKYADFQRLNTELLALSIDSNPSHIA